MVGGGVGPVDGDVEVPQVLLVGDGADAGHTIDGVRVSRPLGQVTVIAYGSAIRRSVSLMILLGKAMLKVRCDGKRWKSRWLQINYSLSMACGFSVECFRLLTYNQRGALSRCRVYSRVEAGGHQGSRVEKGRGPGYGAILWGTSKLMMTSAMSSENLQGECSRRVDNSTLLCWSAGPVYRSTQWKESKKQLEGVTLCISRSTLLLGGALALVG